MKQIFKSLDVDRINRRTSVIISGQFVNVTSQLILVIVTGFLMMISLEMKDLGKIGGLIPFCFSISFYTAIGIFSIACGIFLGTLYQAKWISRSMNQRIDGELLTHNHIGRRVSYTDWDSGVTEFGIIYSFTRHLVFVVFGGNVATPKGCKAEKLKFLSR
jgi:hypothetical protein